MKDMKLKRKLIALVFILLAIGGAMCFLNDRYKIYACNNGHTKTQYGLSVMSFNVTAYDPASFSVD